MRLFTVTLQLKLIDVSQLRQRDKIYSVKRYHNSLFVRCKNIFGHRKRMKIFYTNIILQ